MQVKTKNLIGQPLNWATARARGLATHLSAEGLVLLDGQPNEVWYSPAYNPSWGAGIVFAERISLRVSTLKGTNWIAYYDEPNKPISIGHSHLEPLVAAMRCVVEKYLGEEVEIPDELASTT